MEYITVVLFFSSLEIEKMFWWHACVSKNENLKHNYFEIFNENINKMKIIELWVEITELWAQITEFWEEITEHRVQIAEHWEQIT